MVKFRKSIEGESIAGRQRNSIRVTVPREITTVLDINPGDRFKWKCNLSEKEPQLIVEIRSPEEQELER